MSSPMLIFYKTSGCKYCQTIASKWDKMYKEIKKIYPELRCEIIDANKNKKGPSDLKKFSKWYPMFILFNGAEWDLACITGKIDFSKTAVLNGTWENDKLKYTRVYDNSKASDIIKFIALNLHLQQI